MLAIYSTRDRNRDLRKGRYSVYYLGHLCHLSSQVSSWAGKNGILLIVFGIFVIFLLKFQVGRTALMTEAGEKTRESKRCRLEGWRVFQMMTVQEGEAGEAVGKAARYVECLPNDDRQARA